MALRLATLLATVVPALTLSSHSPVDLESYPAFAVSFNEHSPILNETALELVREPLETRPGSLAPKRHLLRTPSGQGFLCTVPSVTIASSKRAQQQAQLDESTRQLERQRGLERGLALLEPMRGGCIYLRQNWFTYSFCYGQEIRQFHAVQVAGSPIPKEDPNAEAYVLGLSPEPSIYSSNPKYGSGSLEVARKEALIPSTLGGGAEGVGLDESGRYLVQVWEGGSTCDKTGLPRTVEVQFHCNTQTIDRIALIRETSICRYVLLIHTPRLCAEPLFLEGADKSSEPASIIDCRPIVSKLAAPDRERVPTIEESTPRDDSPEVLAMSGQRVDGAEPQAAARADQALSDPERTDASTVDPVRQHIDGDEEDPFDESYLEEDDGPDYVDATVMLVYNPETGEIESVETTIDDGAHLEVGDGAAQSRSSPEGHVGPSERRREGDPQEEETVQVDKLEDMVRLMTQSLAKAMEESGLSGSSLRNPDDDGSPTKRDDAQSPNEKEHDVRKLLKEMWGVDPLSQAQLDKMTKARQVIHDAKRPRTVAVPKNEAFEQMRRGFGRRYEDEEDRDRRETEGPTRAARDEL